MLSVAVVALGALVIYQGRQLQITTAQLQPSATVTVPSGMSVRVTSPAPTAPKPTPPIASPALEPRATPFHWRRVETLDYRDYMANLRAIGCPEQTIRDIVIADVSKLFAVRRAGLITGGKIVPYWQTAESLPTPDRFETQRQLQEMDRDKAGLIRDLLGVDLATELRKSRDGVSYPENRLGFLSPEKQDQVSAIREEMNEKWPLLQSASAKESKTPDEISAELRRLSEERLARLAKILTPDELLEHELQTSWTAVNLRSRLAAFQPSAEEFTAIYDVQKAFDNEYVHYFGNRTDPPSLQRKEQARQQLEAQIRSILGEQRYTDYVAARQTGTAR